MNRIDNFKTYNSKIDPTKFEYDPSDIKSTFILLTSETYPPGHEKELSKYLPDTKTDKFGNVYKVIGESDTMFTSHLDTSNKFEKRKVNQYLYEKDGTEYIRTDSRSNLGADDKAGVSLMLYMMSKNVPGTYYFFIGEENGGIGSSDLLYNFNLSGVKKCVSLDRRGYNSVITKQLGIKCCSDKFSVELIEKLNRFGFEYELDSTGFFSDSASFAFKIPECTNISVGYENEHTVREIQNISFLEKLGKALMKIDWNSLPVNRKI